MCIVAFFAKGGSIVSIYSSEMKKHMNIRISKGICTAKLI